MMAAEIGQRRAVDHRARRRAELAFEDRVRVGAGDRVHRVEAHAEAGGEQGADGVEVEQRPHQRRVVRHRIDDLDRRRRRASSSPSASRSTSGVSSVLMTAMVLVRAKIASVIFSGAGPPLLDVVFDAEIAVRPAGIVGGGEDDAAVGAEAADQRRGGRRRQQAAAADDDAAEAVGERDADRLLDRLAIEVAAVAADHQRLAGEAVERIEDRLDEVLDIVRLLEHRRLLAQARGAGLLVGDRAWWRRCGSSGAAFSFARDCSGETTAAAIAGGRRARLASQRQTPRRASSSRVKFCQASSSGGLTCQGSFSAIPGA